MKKAKLIMLIALATMTAPLASCEFRGETSAIAGEKGDKGDKGDKGEAGLGIKSIEKTSTSGNVDTYTITYTDDSTSTFTVTNGEDGEQGIQGEPGEDGHTPVITIGENGNWFVDGVDTGVAATGNKGEQGDKGDKGDQGEPGKDGQDGEDGKTAWANTILPTVGGRVVPSIGSGITGTAVTFTMIPQEGYYLEDLSLDGGLTSALDETAPIYDAEKNSYTYSTSMVDNGFVVYATFSDEKTNSYIDGKKYNDALIDSWGNVIKQGTIDSSAPVFESGAGTSDDPLIIATDEQLLEFANADATYFKLSKDLTAKNLILPEGKITKVVDFDNHKLEFTDTKSVMAIQNGQEVTLKNGTLDSATNGFASIGIGSSQDDIIGGKLTLDTMLVNNADSGVVIENKDSELNVINSTINANVFGISTNASLGESVTNVKINIEGSTISAFSATSDDNTGVLINVPADVTITDSTIGGERQALVVRGGDVKVFDSTIKYNDGYYQNPTDSPAGPFYNGEKWGDGNRVPTAAIVVGDNATNAYNYGATLTLDNIKYEETLVEETTGKDPVRPYQIFMNGDSDEHIATLNIDRESYAQFSRIHRGNNTDLNVLDEDPASTNTFIDGKLYTKVYNTDGEFDEVLSTETDISFAGGSGTAEDPLLIADASQFAYLNDPAVIKTGVTDFKITSDLTLETILPISGRAETNIDLGEHKLTIDPAVSVAAQATTSIAQGTLKIFSSATDTKGVLDCKTFINNYTQTSFEIISGASLILDNVDATSDTVFAYPRGDAASVDILNSTVTAFAYGISTNAATSENYNVEINVDNSEVTSTAGAGIIINVPGTLNIIDSIVSGNTHAVFARAGRVNISNSTLKLDNSKDADADAWIGKAWGSGNGAPKGFLVVGDSWNGEKSGYMSSNIQVNLTNISFETIEASGDVETKDYPYVYAYYTGSTEQPTITLDAETIANIGGLEDNSLFSQHNVKVVIPE